MNVKHQDSVVSEKSFNELKTKVAYSSPKMEGITISIQNVILESPTVDPVNPCTED